MSSGAVRAWYLVHKWTSLVCTLFLLMLCLTGLPLIFHEEIDYLSEGERPLPQVAEGAPEKNLDDALQTALAQFPGEIPLFMSFDVEQPVVNVTTGPHPRATVEEMNFISIHRPTAEPVRTPDDEGVMHFLLQLHTDMFLGLGGELFLGFMGFLFFVAIVSGVVVYTPFMRKLRFGTVRLSRNNRAKWLDTHNLLGIVTLMWASVVGLTGVVNTLSTPLVDIWRANELAEMVAPYEGKPVPEQFSSLDAAVKTAMEAAPGMTPQFVAFPGVRFSSNHHYAVWLRGATPATEQLFTPALIDAETGELTDMRSMPWYMTVLRLSQPLHFGDYGGLPMKILWGLLDIASIVILGSGLYLWLARRSLPAPGSRHVPAGMAHAHEEEAGLMPQPNPAE
ncbi:PepSY domain-containing protein [Parvibaculum sp.]|uniref:PepSY-associated TM helix domain-containing protein n=1 Tax=Parvibaculum sp. TaxID=2024848 RepID=UPI000EDEE1A5|nr:PepSY domain-containing protein [Parvibaculum sp.]MBO6667882.1 PepSY domain-containing protein [Parvibaculum sp.]MBO6690745.1 PepSY domain-containing protein [Parvibaculum sp.]MBO6714882.1 PepSY domain-containing protein [Parvibaculum sp.]HAC58874.1 peptidase [Rhodobiaceae bacterium]